MPRRPKPRITDADDAPAKTVTSEALASDVAAFLARGGVISTPISPKLRAVRITTRESRYRYVVVKDDPTR